MPTDKLNLRALGLWVEFFLLYIALPLLLFFTGTRKGIYAALFGGGFYALWQLWRQPGFSWRELWQGSGWSKIEKHRALLLFMLAVAGLTGLTLWLLPDKLLSFPLQRFPLWVLVMVLYPLLSVVPQELIFRSFFYRRYAGIFPSGTLLGLTSGLTFGLSHIILNNWIAPTFCTFGGLLFSAHYEKHRSLKWAVIEHSLYGCFVFTIGIGWYFYTGNWRG